MLFVIFVCVDVCSYCLFILIMTQNCIEKYTVIYISILQLRDIFFSFFVFFSQFGAIKIVLESTCLLNVFGIHMYIILLAIVLEVDC